VAMRTAIVACNWSWVKVIVTIALWTLLRPLFENKLK